MLLDIPDSNNYNFNYVQSIRNLSEIRLPMLERLLPIGIKKEKIHGKMDEEQNIIGN